MAAERRLRTIDPLLVTIGLGLMVAVIALAYPAFRADPVSTPGLILIFSLAAAFVALVVFGWERKKPALSGDAVVDMLDALAEPSCLVWSGGQVLAFNVAWTEAEGSQTALPKPKSAQW